MVGDGDGDDGGGTLMMQALSEALAELPRGRVAGIVALSDGRVHDIDRAPDLPAPMHLLHSGRAGDWDRRLVVEDAPAFAILDEPVTLGLRVEDMGDAPAGDGTVALDIALDGAEAQRFQVPSGAGSSCR